MEQYPIASPDEEPEEVPVEPPPVRKYENRPEDAYIAGKKGGRPPEQVEQAKQQGTAREQAD